MIRRAKILRPILGSELVPRPRLIRVLNESLDRPLILIVGPAGYGKTTMLGEWIGGVEVASAWLTLDADDSELSRFVAHVIAAIQTCVPGAGEAVVDELRRTQTSPHQLGGMLGDELLDLADDLLLVLDDYHEVTDSRVHEFLTALLHYPPPRLHLVISARSDPHLALARQRGRGSLVEIRAAELRFTSEETRHLIRLVTNADVDDRVVDLLQERTEGWVAELRLAAMALRGASNHLTLAETVAAVGDRHVMDFLIEEVLTRQTAAAQDFLLRSSVVDRICGGLGDALLDDAPLGTADAMLQELAQGDLCVEQAGDEPGWYRFHPLFLELLRHRCALQTNQSDIAELHQRASTWFADHGLVDEAVTHAVASGDTAAAADLVEFHANRVLATEDWPSVERWLRALPGTVVRERPALLVAHARIVSMCSGAIGTIGPMLQDAAQLLDSVDSPAADALRAEIAILDMNTRPFDTHVADYLATCEEFLPRLRFDQRAARGEALFWIILALQAEGRIEEAIWRLGHDLGFDAGRADIGVDLALSGLASAHLAEGNLHDASVAATYLLRLASEHELAFGQTWAHFLLGRVAYELNDLAQAAGHFSAAAAHRGRAIDQVIVNSLLGLALVYQVQGKTQDSARTIDHLTERIMDVRGFKFFPTLQSFEARLALLRGDRDAAIHWLGAAGVSIDSASLLSFEVPLITRVKVLLVEGTPDGVGEALRLLDLMCERATAMHHRGRLTEAQALRALAFHAQGSGDQARAALERALALGAPKSYLRTFVDLGSRLTTLLRPIARAGDASAYATHILAALDHPTGDRRSADQPGRFKVFELLTEREAQILDGLRRRLSVQEIADELFISPLTVKRHSSNIYDKLGVDNRRQALLRAEELGFLASD